MSLEWTTISEPGDIIHVKGAPIPPSIQKKIERALMPRLSRWYWKIRVVQFNSKNHLNPVNDVGWGWQVQSRYIFFPFWSVFPEWNWHKTKEEARDYAFKMTTSGEEL